MIVPNENLWTFLTPLEQEEYMSIQYEPGVPDRDARAVYLEQLARRRADIVRGFTEVRLEGGPHNGNSHFVSELKSDFEVSDVRGSKTFQHLYVRKNSHVFVYQGTLELDTSEGVE